MRVFLTGATGFVGGFLLKELRRQGSSVRCLVRDETKARNLGLSQSEIAVGDATRPESLAGLLSGCDAVIHLIAIIDEHKRRRITFERLNVQATVNMLRAAQAQGVRRFIHISALGADPDAATPYFRSKGRAETAVKNSGIGFTIFRPSFIYGPGDAVYTMLANVIKRSPLGLMPIFGDGRYRHQPVHVQDLAKGVVASLTSETAVNKIYNVGGPSPVAYYDQLMAIGKAVNKKVRPAALPLWLSKAVIGAFGRLPRFPINSDKLQMLTTDNICDPLPFAEDFKVSLRSFEEGIRRLSF